MRLELRKRWRGGRHGGGPVEEGEMILLCDGGVVECLSLSHPVALPRTVTTRR